MPSGREVVSACPVLELLGLRRALTSLAVGTGQCCWLWAAEVRSPFQNGVLKIHCAVCV